MTEKVDLQIIGQASPDVFQTGRRLRQIIIPFAFDPSHSPNLRNQQRKLDAYWRCIVCCCWSQRMFDDRATRIVVLTDLDPSPDVREHLRRLGVDFEARSYSFDPGPNFTMYRSSFYKLDALAFAAETPEADSIVLDPDTLILEPLSDAWEALVRDGLQLYELSLEDGYGSVLHRVTLDAVAHAALGPGRAPTSYFCGGEYLAVRGDLAWLVAAKAEALFRANVIRADPVFVTEEHIYTALAMTRTVPWSPANRFISRLWTHSKRMEKRQVCHTPIAHLPAEKDAGFELIFRLISVTPARHRSRRLIESLAGLDPPVAARGLRLAWVAFRRLSAQLTSRARRFRGSVLGAGEGRGL